MRVSNRMKLFLSLMLVFLSKQALAQQEVYSNNLGEVVTLVVDQEYFISTEVVLVRNSMSDVNRENVVGKLRINERVVLAENPILQSGLVGVKIKKSYTFKPTNPQDIFYVAKKFLSSVDMMKKKSPYFIVQNIATEVTRVYKRCDTSLNCPHQMVFETKMVVGRPEEGTEKNDNAFKTMLGHGRIAEWIKFYQDNSGHYPHWYREGQSLASVPPKAPLDSRGRPDSTFSWGKKWQTKVNGESTIYGAFGWYAAKVYPPIGPNGFSSQWIHGTIGWGSDGEAAIELTRSTLLNMFSNPGSAGCTRLSNSAIAYLRHLVPPGTDFYRVYARETTRLNDCAKKSILGVCKVANVFPAYKDFTKKRPWSYVMLTDEAQKSGGISADAFSIERLGIVVQENVNLLERGTYYVDMYPNSAEADYHFKAFSGLTGDRYSIDDQFGERPTNFVGKFLVDEGRFVDYQHPKHKNILIGGLPEFRTKLPHYLKTSGDSAPIKVTYKEKPR